MDYLNRRKFVFLKLMFIIEPQNKTNNKINTMTNETKPKITNAPMALGIIGTVLGLPAALCGAVCGAAGALAKDKGFKDMMSDAAKGDTAAMREKAMEMVTANGGEAAKAASTSASIALYLCLLGVLLGLISSIMYKKNTKTWGMVMMLGGLAMAITIIWANWLGVIAGLCCLIGGFLSYSYKQANA